MPLMNISKHNHNAFRKKSPILFLYYGPHPFHKGLADSIGADYKNPPKLNTDNLFSYLLSMIYLLWGGATLPDYDIYFCEGTYLFPAFAKMVGLIPKDKKIINLLADPMLYYLKTGVISGLRKKVRLELLKEVNGFVCVSKMEEELLKEYLPNANAITAYPYPSEERAKALAAVVPDLTSFNILFIGNGSRYSKGVDILLEAFAAVKEQWPGSQLNIVGNLDSKEPVGKYERMRGVNFLGYLDGVNLTAAMSGSSLYVHCGRGDAFALSVIEAMQAGLPAIVSRWTGSKEVVEKIDKRFVVDLDSKFLAAAINIYFSMGISERKKVSIKARKFSMRFKKNKTLKKFKSDFKKLCRKS